MYIFVSFDMHIRFFWTHMKFSFPALIDFLSFFRVVGSSLREPGVLRDVVCCSVLQCVAVCCGMLRFVAVQRRAVVGDWCRTGVAVFCSVLHYATLCCRLQSVALCYSVICSVLQCAVLCCSVLHCVAVRWRSVAGACCLVCAKPLNTNPVCCTVLPCIAQCCSVLHLCSFVLATRLTFDSVCCSMLRCVAVYCSVLQFVQSLLFVVSYLHVVCGMGGEGQKA